VKEGGCVFYYCRTYYNAVRVGGEESTSLMFHETASLRNTLETPVDSESPAKRAGEEREPERERARLGLGKAPTKSRRVMRDTRWRTCAMRDDEPRPVWISLPITH
jgi:hypothetical protein